VDEHGWLSSVTAPGGLITRLTAKPDGLLTEFIDVGGQPHTFTYDVAGRLQRDDDPAGGFQTLTRTSATTTGP
jgi:YD repeat-containing protein